MNLATGRRHTQVLALAALTLVGGALAAGCGPAVPNITVMSPGTPTPASDMATIVVVQPTTHFPSVSIVDGNARLLGQLNDRSYTVFQVPPGQVRLYAFWENQIKGADRVEGVVQAGKIYYTTISFRWGGVSFLALNQRSPDGRWAQKDEYLGKAPRVQMDPAKSAEVLQKIGTPPAMFQYADENVSKMDAAHQAERVIQAQDGV
jgi:hypothetical protein